jgi:hypothetical protein
MSQPASTRSEHRKNLKGTLILFLAIVIGIFLFMLAAVLVGQTRGALIPALNKHHTVLAAVMAVVSFGCLFLGKQIFTRDLLAAKNSLKPLQEKLNMHRQALIKYLVISEVPVMLSIILFLLTANFVFQVYAGVFLGFMLTVTPVRKKVAEQLELNDQEQRELE